MARIQNSKFYSAWQRMDPFPSSEGEPCGTPGTILSQKSSCTVRTWWLEFIVMNSKKLWPSYLLSAHASVPYSVLFWKSSRTAAWVYCGTQWNSVTRLSAVCMCHCSLSVLSQKSSHLVCTWWLKSIVAHSEKLLLGYLISLHTSFPAFKLYSMAPSWLFVFGEANYTLPNVLQEGELLS